MVEGRELATSLATLLAAEKGKLAECTCAECEVRRRFPEHPGLKSWTDMNCLIGARGLIDICCCKREPVPELQAKGASKPPKLHTRLCSKQGCKKCGVKMRVDVDGQTFSRLPTRCPALFNSKTQVQRVRYEDVPRNTGTQEELVASLIPGKQLMQVRARLGGSTTARALLTPPSQEIISDLPGLVQHYGDYSIINMLRIKQAAGLEEGDVMISTDFAATYSVLAQDRKCCATDRHILLDMFVCLHSPRDVTVEVNGKPVTKRVVTCDVFGFWGDTKSKSKLTDERTHTACLDSILEYYTNESELTISKLYMHSDNCAGQYKCKYMLYALAGLQVKYKIKRIQWQFAVVGQFKGPHDGYGFVYKRFQSTFLRYPNGRQTMQDQGAAGCVRRQIQNNHCPANEWEALFETRDAKILTKGTYQADRYIVGRVAGTQKELDATPEGALRALCVRSGDEKRDFDVSEIDGINSSWSYYLKLEDHVPNMRDEADGQEHLQAVVKSTRLPVLCPCASCQNFRFEHCVQGEQHDVKTSTLIWKKKAEPAKPREQKAEGRVVCVAGGGGGPWRVGLGG
jgi:hypothetical protein